jgi:hypothetical protein
MRAGEELDLLDGENLALRDAFGDRDEPLVEVSA